MKEIRFEPGEREEWLYTRRGKITGSRLKAALAKPRDGGKNITFYELVAEKLGMPPENDENQMERGARLEADALERFKAETKKEVDTSLILWHRDENENIAISPDGVIGRTEAVEAKCLSSARHIEGFLTKKIPADYEYQVLQYFIVNDELETLHFVFFDPRFAMFSDPSGKQAKIDYFVIEVKREEVQAQVEDILTRERVMMVEVNSVVNQLTF